MDGSAGWERLRPRDADVCSAQGRSARGRTQSWERTRQSCGTQRGRSRRREWVPDESACAACRANGDIDAGEREEQLALIAGEWTRAMSTTERGARVGEPRADVGWSEQAVVANFHEARGQDVLDEAIEEVDGVERDGVAVLGLEGDAAFVVSEEAMVGEANAVCVAAEIPDDMLGAAEGSLGIRDEACLAKGDAESIEGFGILVVRAQLAGAVCGRERMEELCTKERAEDAHKKEVARARADPAVVGVRPTAARDDAVDVRMKAQIARPGVKDGRDAEERRAARDRFRARRASHRQRRALHRRRVGD